MRTSLTMGLWMVGCVSVVGQTVHSVDRDWQAQFAGATKWSTLGVNDDNGATDNLAALNALPGTLLIADCPHGGRVRYSGSWERKDGQKIWYQNCPVESTIITPGIYPIQNPGGFTNLVPLVGVADYEQDFTILTPTQGVREYSMNCQHCVFKGWRLHGGGLGLFGGSDREISFGATSEVIEAAGNPCVRDIGQETIVQTSPGLWDNVVGKYLNCQVGDAAFQVGQPTGQPNTWPYAPSTNGVTYYHSYRKPNASGSVILVNEQLTKILRGDSYEVNNVKFIDVYGGGRSDIIISPGGPSSATHNVLISGGSYDGSLSTTALAAVGIGQVKRGPFNFTGDLGLVRVENRSFLNPFLQAVEIAGPYSWIWFQGDNVAVSQKTVTRAAAVSVKGTSQFNWIGGSIAVQSTSSFGAISLGDGDVTTIDANLQGLTISGIADGQVGMKFNKVQGGTIGGNVLVPAIGSVSSFGFVLTSGPNGTHGLIAQDNDLSAMPIQVQCVPGQGNVVQGCP